MLHEILVALLGQAGGVIKNKGDGLRVSSFIQISDKGHMNKVYDFRPHGAFSRMFRPSSKKSWEIDKTTNNLSIDKLFVIPQILLSVKGQINVFTFLSFMSR